MRAEAWETARRVNDAQGGTDWETDVCAHLMGHGSLVATRDTVLLWRPVWSHWGEEDLCDPWQSDPDGDAIYLWMAVGGLATFAALCRSGAFPVKSLLAYHRRGNPKWYRLETLIARIDGKEAQQ